MPKWHWLFRIRSRCAEMNENLLLVEDEQALRTALEVRLRAEGYVVDTAEDGEDGLQKATNLPFDLIILDVMLPYRSGLDVCRGVRQLGLATPILILTVRDQVVDKVVTNSVRSASTSGEQKLFETESIFTLLVASSSFFAT